MEKQELENLRIGNSDGALSSEELRHYKKAGEIAKKVIAYAKEIIKPGMLLSEIAGKIHKKIEELGGVPAFPVNLAVNDIAAHYHPSLEDETKAEGLLKVDIGVHVEGYIADTAFSLDLTPDKKYEKLIKASEEALENALKLLEKNPDLALNEIGKTIQETIENKKFIPIINLSGHSLGQYNLHAGTTIPNYANGSKKELKEGAYAIEPFATTGEGRIYEGGSSNIYRIETPKTPRSPNARKILEYVFEKYQTLPFSLREVQEKFPGARIALRELEQQGIIKNYLQLIEESHMPVSQTEHTIVIKDGKVIVTTR